MHDGWSFRATELSVAFISATFDRNLVSSVFQFVEDLGNSRSLCTFELYLLTVFTSDKDVSTIFNHNSSIDGDVSAFLLVHEPGLFSLAMKVRHHPDSWAVSLLHCSTHFSLNRSIQIINFKPCLHDPSLRGLHLIDSRIFIYLICVSSLSSSKFIAH